MALIDTVNFKRVEKERNSIHGNVKSTYTSFITSQGDKYFQIDTYGSNGREVKGKISQSIQLDKEVAECLISLLKREFEI
jgi:hypothetical protein